MVFAIADEGECFWQGFAYTGSILNSVYVRSAPGYAGNVKIGWISSNTAGGEEWFIDPGMLLADTFTCLPWSFSLTGEILDDLVPTGDFMTITVDSVP